LNLNIDVKIMKKLRKCSLFVFMLLFSAVAVSAQKDIYLSLSAAGKRSDIGIECFNAVNKNGRVVKAARLIKEIVENDLILSRYFNVIQGMTEENTLALKEKLLLWEKRGVAALITGSVSGENSNLTLEMKITDVVSGEVIWEHKYRNKYLNCRYLAHEVSDEIVRRITGEMGIARSKIVFVNDSTGFKELYIVDYDGYNLRRLTKDNKINILPKLDPDGRQIIYTSYIHNNPDLFILNLAESKRSVVSKYQGLNVAGSFAPDGRKILLTLSRGGYPNLYMINTSGELLRRMTEEVYISTSPSFAPNGREIVFISDRPGYPQLYIMSVDGRNIRRLTTSSFCDSPAWSPRGDKIAFTMRQTKGNYDLYIYDLLTAKITKITDNQANNENPAWSPDGRFLTFYSNRSGKGEIYVMAIDGSGTRKLAEMPGASYTPAWSPVLAN
jgi:TolB protein